MMMKSRIMEWTTHVARMAEKRNAYRTLFGNSKGKRPHRIPRYTWKDNIRMDLGETGFEVVGWI
jgi:hypothetical protein